MLRAGDGATALHWTATRTDPATRRTVEWGHFSTSLPRAARGKRARGGGGGAGASEGQAIEKPAATETDTMELEMETGAEGAHEPSQEQPRAAGGLEVWAASTGTAADVDVWATAGQAAVERLGERTDFTVGKVHAPPPRAS